MLTDERKAAVDKLTDEELEFEVARGRASRFQRELYDYAKVRLAARKDAKKDTADAAELQLGQEAVKVGKQTRNATHIAWVVALVVGIAVVVAMVMTAN